MGTVDARTYHIKACSDEGVEGRYLQISEDGESWWVCHIPRESDQSWLQYIRQVQHLFADEACRVILFHTL